MICNGSRFSFAMEIYRQGRAGRDAPLAVVALDVDWQPALAYARLEAVRADHSMHVDFDTTGGRIVPVWHRRLGRPYLRQIRVTLPGATGWQRQGWRIGARYFTNHARSAARTLVDESKLAPGDAFDYLVSAQPTAPAVEPSGLAGELTVEAASAPVALRTGSIDRFTARATNSGRCGRREMRVFFCHRVLRQTTALTRAAGDVETGGILLGHLYRDAARHDAFLLVSAQVPARLARGRPAELTFTPDAWVDLDAARRRRGRDEICVGYWHSHPLRQQCRECPAERRRRCRLTGEFFSADDALLHRCVFPRAYSVALVVSDSHTTGLTWPLFGWSRGVIRRRGYSILGPGSLPGPAAAGGAAVNEGAQHGTSR